MPMAATGRSGLLANSCGPQEMAAYGADLKDMRGRPRSPDLINAVV